MDLSETIRLIYDELEPYKIRHYNRQLFATDLALIGLSIRIGYLVDSVSFNDPQVLFPQILKGLAGKLSLFRDVVHLYDPCSEQSFFINIKLFLRSPPSEISFILLPSTGSSLKLLSGTPQPVAKVLEGLRNQLLTATVAPVTISLPPDLTAAVTVPLAALLLEYPVAYVPENGQASSSLSKLPLIVYECTLTWDVTSSLNPFWHTLLKFSCPALFEELSTSRILDELTSRFAPRVRHLAANPKLTIHHRNETRDSVVL